METNKINMKTLYKPVTRNSICQKFRFSQKYKKSDKYVQEYI